MGVSMSRFKVLKDCVMAATIKKGLEEQNSEDTALVIGDFQYTHHVPKHTCKKRVMLRRRLFWPKKIAEKVRKSRQNVNRDKSA